MRKRSSSYFFLVIVRGLALVGWSIVLFAIIPIGLAAMIEGISSLYDGYLQSQHEFNAFGIALLAVGAGVILIAILLSLLLAGIDSWSRSQLNEVQYTVWGHNSIKRLEEWLPKKQENMVD